MSTSITKDTLLEVWRRDMDEGYTSTLESEDDGRGLDPIAGLAAIMERVSVAVMNTTEALYLRPHVTQAAPPASGPVFATGIADVSRGIVVGGPVNLVDGDVLIAQFTGVNGDLVEAPEVEVVGAITIPAGSVGPTAVPVRARRPGWQGNVPSGTLGRFPARSGASIFVIGFDATTGIVTADPAGDIFFPAMTGMFLRFTSGANIGAYARRLTVTSPTTAILELPAGMATTGGCAGQVVDFDAVGDFSIVFRAVEGGRTGELDYLAREQGAQGRSINEDDEDMRARLAALPDAITPDAMARAIAAVLDPVAIPFDIIEVFEQSVGFVFSGTTGPTTTDSAFSDPFAYRNAMFFVGGPTLFPIGFLVVVNGLSLPGEPERTRILSALTGAITATKGIGVPWAVAFEPPIP